MKTKQPINILKLVLKTLLLISPLLVFWVFIIINSIGSETIDFNNEQFTVLGISLLIAGIIAGLYILKEIRKSVLLTALFLIIGLLYFIFCGYVSFILFIIFIGFNLGGTAAFIIPLIFILVGVAFLYFTIESIVQIVKQAKNNKKVQIETK